METYTLPAFPSAYSTIHIALFANVTNAPEIRRRLIRASTLEGPEGEAARAQVDFGFIEARLLVSRLHLLTAISATFLTAFPTPLPPPSSSSTPLAHSDNTSIPSSASESASTSASISASASGPAVFSASASASTTPPSLEASGTASSTPTRPQTRSHNLHSEILLSLSPNNNISDSIRRHGLSDTTSFLAVVRFGPPCISSPSSLSSDALSSDPQASQAAQASQAEILSAMQDVVDGDLVSLDELGRDGNLDTAKVDKIYKLGELGHLKLSPPDLARQREAVIVSSIATKSVT